MIGKQNQPGKELTMKIISTLGVIAQITLVLFATQAVRAEENSEVDQIYVEKDPILHTDDWNIRVPGFTEAWKTTEGDPRVHILLIDTGVDYHPEFEDRVHGDTAFLMADGYSGHGTSVAGVLIAARGNGIGGNGVCPNCSIDSLEGNNLSEAIPSAITNKNVAINFNWSLSYDEEKTDKQIDAEKNGIVIIASQGNKHSDEPQYPASSPCTLGVISVDRYGNRAESSNHGLSADISAPGITIYTTDLLGENGYAQSDYAVMYGTSLAAPHVTGLAALIRSVRKDLSARDVRRIILSSAADLGEPGFDPEFGFGEINATQAMSLTKTWVKTEVLQDCRLNNVYRAYGRTLDADGKPKSTIVRLMNGTEEIDSFITSDYNGIYVFDYLPKAHGYTLQIEGQSVVINAQQYGIHQWYAAEHDFTVIGTEQAEPNLEVVAPTNLRVITTDYGKTILFWDGAGETTVIDNDVPIQHGTQTSITIWSRDHHHITIWNEKGEIKHEFDNSIKVYLPMIER